MIPEQAEKLLDLGCGTGLELDEISAARPSLQITGIDLSPDMLAVLAKKHPQVRLIQADYFSYDFGASVYDMAVSFESLHHFKQDKKLGLYKRCLLYTSFTAENVDQEYERLLEKGVEICEKPVSRPWGARNMSFYDPDGNLVYIRSFPK